MHRLRRFLLVLALTGVFFGLAAAEEATSDERWPHPPPADVDADYDRYVGERTLVFGTVEAVDDGRLTIRVSHDEGGFGLSVVPRDGAVDQSAAVRPGGTVQVLGVLAPDRRIGAESIVAVDPGPGSRSWKYGLSLVGVGVFLVVFVRHWRVNREELRVEARTDG